jgi:hypothetical protein
MTRIFCYCLFLLFSLHENIFSAAHKGLPSPVISLDKEPGFEIWRDLQPAVQYALPETYNRLISEIEIYNKIAKDSREDAKSRISLLKQIEETCEKHLAADSSQKKLQEIKRIAHNKADYISKILATRSEIYQRLLHILPSQSESELRTGRFLREPFIPEMIYHLDPAFRSEKTLKPAVMEWSASVASSGKGLIPDFFFWLEARPEKTFELYSRFNDAGVRLDAYIEQRRVVFSPDGRAWTIEWGNKEKEGQNIEGQLRYAPLPLDGSKIIHSYLYNIDGQGDLYINWDGYHSDVLRGKVILSAGHISFRDDGHIEHISNHSGHYAPSAAQFKKALRVLDAKWKSKGAENIFHNSTFTTVSSNSEAKSIEDIADVSMSAIELKKRLEKIMSAEEQAKIKFALRDEEWISL